MKSDRKNIPPRGELPAHYTPRTAGHAKGPLITEPDNVRDSAWAWRNNRTYVVRHESHDYRAVRVFSGGRFLGYWAVELLGIELEI